MVKVTETLVSPQLLLDGLKTSASGSIVMHLGVVRPDSGGRKVVSIEYEANYQGAIQELSRIASDLLNKWPIEDIALLRRVGKLKIGDVILIAAVAAPHRKEAFEACDYAVEQMRNMASVKKREVFE